MTRMRNARGIKRKWLGVAIMAWASLAQLFLNVPVALAGSSGTCINDTSGCVTLNVNLNVTNGGNISQPATIWVNRQNGSGIDNAFTLDPKGGNTSYTSGGPIFGTAPSDTNCNGGDTQFNMYKITVSGSATGGTNGYTINLCTIQTTGPPGNRVATVTLPVQAAGSTATTGGIHGTFDELDLAGNRRLCANASANIFGPTSMTVTLDNNGNLTVPTGLQPGTYTVEVNCVINGGAGIIKVPPFTVKAGQVTDIGNHTCDPKVDNCGLSGGGPTPHPPPKPDPGKDVTPTCDAGQALTWFICGGIKFMVGVIDWIRDNIVVPFLEEKPLDKNGDGQSAYRIWSAFRNVASIFFILIFFLVIFGTAIGWDNYTIKKIIPRLVAGAILVPFSWYLCVAFLDVGNILGHGLVSLSSSIIPPADISFKSSISKLFLGGAIALGVAGASTAVSHIGFGVVISMLIAFLTVFFTLVLRKILIILLVVLSPFAFLLWILPNTEKWFKEWWTNLFKLIMMYPLVMGLFEAGRLFAATAGATAGNAAEKGVTPLFQLLGLTLPLFGVPFAFSWAGKGLKLGQAAIGKAAGSLDKSFGKSSDFAKDLRQRGREKSAAAATGRPVTKLGKILQRNPNSRMAKVARAVAAKRSGHGGFVHTSAAGRRKLETLADKSFSDQASADAIKKSREEEIAKNQFLTADALVNQRTSAQVAEIRKKNKAAALAVIRNARGGSGLALEDVHHLAKGGTVVEGGTYTDTKGNTQTFSGLGIGDQALSGQIIQEAAIEHLAKQGEYDELRKSWNGTSAASATATISSERLRAGLAGDPDAVSKARDLVLGSEMEVGQQGRDLAPGEQPFDPTSDLSRRSTLKGRSVDQFAGFDKSTRWEYIDQINTLKDHYESLPAGSGERAAGVAAYNEHTEEVFRNLVGALSAGGAGLDPKTLQAARSVDEHGSVVYGYFNGRDLFAGQDPTTAAQKRATLAEFFNPDGSVKKPVQQMEIVNWPGSGGTP